MEVCLIPDLVRSRLVVLRDYCRARGIRRMDLFGSATTPEFDESSDIDLLVEFEPSARVTLFDMAAMRDELSDLLGRPVDLATSSILRNPYRRRAIMRSIEPLHVA